MGTQQSRVLRLGSRGRLFTAAEAARDGIHTSVLTRLVRDGTLERVSRGRYRLAGRSISKHHGLVLAATAVPDGVICLLSALAFHEIGTQLPSDVWIARGRGTWDPRVDYPPIRVVRFSGEALVAGVETHTLEGRKVKIYGIAKTIADCFKFRNKIGLDVALEALTDAWRHRRFRMDELDRYSRICRVQNIMRPYLEALAA